MGSLSRESALTMVRLLGHVIHVLQDMAQPQHVLTTTTSHCLSCPLTLHSDSNIRVPMSTGSKTTSITSLLN